MSDERRYSDEEVEMILHRAVEQSVERRQHAVSASEGMTLGQLEEIAREVGVSAEHVRAAASSVDRVQGVRRQWGLPLSVYHTVPLSRDLSDREWSQLVADLRQTFGARGKVEGTRGMRGWTNGNLHAFVEPAESGWRLRMGTTKGDAKAFTGVGSLMLLMSLCFSVAIVLGLGDSSELLGIIGTMGPMGLAFLGAGALQLPSWSQKRQEQMEQVERRLLARLATAEEARRDEEG